MSRELAEQEDTAQNLQLVMFSEVLIGQCDGVSDVTLSHRVIASEEVTEDHGTVERDSYPP